MKNWYLLQTKARQEFIAEKNLARQKYQVYLPCIKQTRKIKNKWQEIPEPFFPGYLFIHLDIKAQNTSTVRSTRGVLKLVKFGMEPQQVPENLIEEIRNRIHKDNQSVTPLPLKEGDRVKISDGCFEGMEAIFQSESGTERVTLLLEILGRCSQIILNRNQIAPVK